MKVYILLGLLFINFNLLSQEKDIKELNALHIEQTEALATQLINNFKKAERKKGKDLTINDYLVCIADAMGNGDQLKMLLEHRNRIGRFVVVKNIFTYMKRIDREVYYRFLNTMADERIDSTSDPVKSYGCDCSNIQNGVYKYELFNRDPFRLERYGNLQYDYSPFGYLIQEVKWHTPCAFSLIYKDEYNRRTNGDFKAGDEIIIYVVKNRENDYIYVSNFVRTGYISFGMTIKTPERPYRFLKPDE